MYRKTDEKRDLLSVRRDRSTFSMRDGKSGVLFEWQMERGARRARGRGESRRSEDTSQLSF